MCYGWGGGCEKAKPEGIPKSEDHLPLRQRSPLPCARGLPWRGRSVMRGPVCTCFIMASVASILGAEGKGTTKS